MFFFCLRLQVDPGRSEKLPGISSKGVSWCAALGGGDTLYGGYSVELLTSALGKKSQSATGLIKSPDDLPNQHTRMIIPSGFERKSLSGNPVNMLNMNGSSCDGQRMPCLE